MYDNDLDNNNTSSGVTGSESQNSQEVQNTDIRQEACHTMIIHTIHHIITIHGIPIMAVIIQILIIQTLRATLIIIKRKTRQTKRNRKENCSNCIVSSFIWCNCRWYNVWRQLCG